ncbi:MAG: HD domain-containing protein [Alphaproteobacteria bacterium]|nr:HD domain-containing protein [Alphaproteobacteria bacterium]MCB9691119.1 HD domain-containing protein [Alphaproteobacteria bacterium]
MLDDLDGVEQDPVWHPEGDALFHSLQVWALARRASPDRELWAAALLHDVGKGLPGDHDATGAALLRGFVPDRVVWLVAHHLDLLRQPRRTRRKLRGTRRLADLEHLRRWDVGGRDPHAYVVPVVEAVESLREIVLPTP